MNDLLRDIIEVEDVVVFIDDIIIATETEEEYDNIIEKVLRRIVKNNLFVNLEKHVWKIREVREVGFLGPDRVKMEKEKV